MVAEAAGAGPFPDRVAVGWAGRGLPEAVSALGAAARAFALTLSTPRPPGPGGPLSGMDYLTVIAERHKMEPLAHDQPEGSTGRMWYLLPYCRRRKLTAVPETYSGF